MGADATQFLMGTPTGTYVWAVLFLIGAIWSGLLYLRSTAHQASTFISSGEAHFVHIVMHLVMGLMLFFMADAVVMGTLVIALGVTGLIIIVGLLKAWRSGEPIGQGVVGGTLYHLVALGVMMLAMLSMGEGGHGSIDHAAHHGAMSHAAGAAAAAGVTWKIPLMILFLIDGVATLIFALLLPRTLIRLSGTPRPHARDVRAVRLAAPPHVVMALGMAAMLAG
jgi:hypothetical protein